MNAIIGHVIVIAVLLVIVFFCGRYALRQIKAELSGQASCAGCKNGCGGGCTSCSSAGQCPSYRKTGGRVKRHILRNKDRLNAGK